MADAAFLALMNRQVEIYTKADDTAAVSAWEATGTRLYIRFRPARTSVQGDGWTNEVTHLARTPFGHPDGYLQPKYVEYHLPAGALLKEVARRDPATGAWEAITDGSEYLVQGAPENAAGADHHLTINLVRLANNEATVAQEIDP